MDYIRTVSFFNVITMFRVLVMRLNPWDFQYQHDPIQQTMNYFESRGLVTPKCCCMANVSGLCFRSRIFENNVGRFEDA